MEWSLLVVQRLGILLELAVVTCPCGQLEKMYCIRIIQVLLLVSSELVGTYACKGKVCIKSQRVKC